MLAARRQAVPVTLQVLAVVKTHRGGPLHYKRIRHYLPHLHAYRVLNACRRLAAQGRLRWCAEGVYALPRETGDSHG
jgi:hypothetical protein